MDVLTVDGKKYPFDSALTNKPAWEVTINGEFIEDVDTLSVINHQMGIGFLYGASPAGPYNQGRIVNRGGSVIVPTVMVDDFIYFLAIRQGRPLVGEEPILEFPRGQSLRGEESLETARREFLEEMGAAIPAGGLTYLGQGNPDTSLIHGANVHAWWLKLPSDIVEFDEYHEPQLRKELYANAESKLMENILHAELVREDEFQSPSMMTSWAMGLVFRKLWLEEDGVILNHPLSSRPFEHDGN